MNRFSNIAIFDSGIGGLSVMQEIAKQLPQENIIYLADSANFPYGMKTPQTINLLSRQIADFLMQQDIKALVIACHTASAHAYETLQATLPIPVIDVISPTIEYMIPLCSPKDHIALLATEGTIASGVYQKQFLKSLPDTKITSKACPLLVTLIEKGMHHDGIGETIIQEYLKPLKRKVITKLILGCTHFSFAQKQIKNKLYGVDVIDSAKHCTTKLTKTLSTNLLNQQTTLPRYQFFVTNQTKNFHDYIKIFPKNHSLHPIKIILH